MFGYLHTCTQNHTAHTHVGGQMKADIDVEHDSE